MSPELSQWIESARYFSYKNFRIAFHEHGSGPAMVCLHGFPTSSQDWQALLPQLQQRFRVITLDFLGFGLSDKPTDYEYLITEQADIVEALLEHLQIEQYDLLAHDYGDTVAQELLARDKVRKEHKQDQGNEQDGHSGRIQSCVLLNGGIFPERHRPILGQKLLASRFGPWLSKRAPFWMVRLSLQRTFSPQFCLTSEQWSDMKYLVEHDNGIEVQAQLIGYIEQRIQHRERWVDSLVNAPCPVLFISGRLDPISGKPMAERFWELIRNPNCLLLECGHYPQLEAPDDIWLSILQLHEELDMCRARCA